MKTTVTGRHLDVTPELHKTVLQKLGKVERLLNDSAVSVQVVLSREHRDCLAEVVLHARGDRVLHGEGSGSTWSRAIGSAVEKVDQQAHTLKGKWEGRRRRSASEAGLED